MMVKQYKLLSVVCKLYDGEHYVKEAEIRKKWKKCPSHNAILNATRDDYLLFNYDSKDPGYIPTPRALEIVRERRRSTVLLIVAVATLFLTGFQFLNSLF